MDYSLYHQDWRDVIRPAILKRDQYKCVQCGARHKMKCYKDTSGKYIECDDFMEQWAISSGRHVFTLYLQVAHKDHDKSNNDPSNLMTLCPVHHARYDSEHKRFARIMYKAKIKDSKDVEETPEIPLRTKLLTTIEQSIRKITGLKLTKSDCEIVLQDVLTCYDSASKK